MLADNDLDFAALHPGYAFAKVDHTKAQRHKEEKPID